MSKFWKAALIRAARTFFQVIPASIGSAYLLSDVNWAEAISAAALAAILSLATSIATGLPEVEE